jgi:hypothetical protein
MEEACDGEKCVLFNPFRNVPYIPIHKLTVIFLNTDKEYEKLNTRSYFMYNNLNVPH